MTKRLQYGVGTRQDSQHPSNAFKHVSPHSNVVGHGIFRFDKDDSLIGEPVSPISLRVSTVDPNIVSAPPLPRVGATPSCHV